MSADAQKLVLTRLELWVSATIQRLLGPLFSLRGMQEGSPQLQELAVKIANALGVLERQPVRNIVRGLDQNSRAVLRKHGVRFGSYYLYVPSTLRPASRALALQLWCLQKKDEEFSAAAQGLIPMASSGRTSAPPDVRVGGDTYRVGGFRSCGDRVVRVDIVERLADMIRAASTLRVVNGTPSGPAAFQVTSQMTSLTGCSGEGFASILKALGFESLTVRRGEIVWPAAAAPVAPPAETTDAPSPEAETADGDPDGNPDIAPDATPETVPDAMPDVAALAAADASPPSDLGSDADEAPPAVDSSVGEPVGISSDSDASPPGPPTEIETAAQIDVEMQPQPNSVTTDNETVTIWRFARPPAPSHPRPARQPRRRFPAPSEQRVQSQAGAEAPDGLAPGVESRANGPAPQERRPPPSERPFHEGKRKTWSATKPQRRPDDKREARAASGDRPDGEKKPAVDPMSPFAKLLELRSILESESKKRS